MSARRAAPRHAVPAPGRSGSLLDRARAVLADGGLPTAALAERVLGLRGNPPVAAAAVFTLLGAEPDFRVDAAGVWTLAAPEPRASDPGPAEMLGAERWVVVDVETTGGSPDHGHRITEVAAVWVEGRRVAGSFATLVNPERHIPSMITSLTGITNKMVAGAPRFEEVAARVREALAGRVFVAHNAAFDARFIGAELLRSDGPSAPPAIRRQLCTVRLSRRLLPELPSRSLDALAVYFDLRIEARHRALDDALATAEVLLRLLDRLEELEVRGWTDLQKFLANRKPRARKPRAMPRSMDSA